MFMFKHVQKYLSDKPVNTGRQPEVDYAKAAMVLCLPFIHCIIECIPEEALASGIPYLFDSIIGGPFSAPTYLFAMGIGLVYSRKKDPKEIMMRGLILIGIFYLSNSARFLFPYLIGYSISGDREHFIDPLLYRWLGNDVLLFAGISIVVIAIMRALGMTSRSMLITASAMSVASTLIGDVDTNSALGNIFLGYLVGTDDKTGYVISDFPLLTWLIFPVCGYVFGQVLIRAADKEGFFTRVCLPFLIVPAVYFPLGIHFRWGMFGEGQNCYYHMQISDVAVCLCLSVGMIGFWHLVSKRAGDALNGFMEEVSRNITAIYCIHWVFVRTITNVILYIVNGTQELPLAQTLLLSFAILIVSLALARFYKRAQQNG